MSALISKAKILISAPFIGESEKAVILRHWDLIGDAIEAKIWEWFEANRNRTVFKKSFWFLRITVKVKDLEPILHALLGDKPAPEI